MIIFFSNQIIMPHFILLGIIFLEGFSAIILNMLIVLGMIYGMYANIKNDYKLIEYFSFILYPTILNSTINIFFTLFFEEDLLGFMSRIMGNNDLFIGYLVNQIMILIVALILLINIKKRRF